MNVKQNADYFRYLYELQASGRVNMFGAEPYLRKEFIELDRETAKEILLYWMNNYDQVAKELGVEV